MNILKRLWKAWQEIAGYIGDFQARLLLTVFYFSVAAPFGLGLRLTSDPLRAHRSLASGWLKRSPQATDLPAARRQF